jgi:iron(III) transport system substrate-binding protein
MLRLCLFVGALAFATGCTTTAATPGADAEAPTADMGVDVGEPAPPDLGETPTEVVIYTSVDQNFSEPVLNDFEAATGIRVLPVFDVEAAKTTGLVNRLIAERDRPQADVWWNGEFAQTIELAKAGILQPYASPNADGIPPQFMDPTGLWTGFGGRARVLLVNTDLLAAEDYPDSIFDISTPSMSAETIGMALPVFGTTLTEAAALYGHLGDEEARAHYEAIEASGVQIVDGNSVVRDMVADGRLAFGLTDTDDACGAIERGAPVEVVFPDQGDDGLGTLIIPNTVAMVAGGPNPSAAVQLIDYLLSEEVATRLVGDGWFQVLLRPIPVEGSCIDATGVRGMDIPLLSIADNLTPVLEELTALYVR